jgi:SAC3/GANP family
MNLAPTNNPFGPSETAVATASPFQGFSGSNAPPTIQFGISSNVATTAAVPRKERKAPRRDLPFSTPVGGFATPTTETMPSPPRVHEEQHSHSPLPDEDGHDNIPRLAGLMADLEEKKRRLEEKRRRKQLAGTTLAASDKSQLRGDTVTAKPDSSSFFSANSGADNGSMAERNASRFAGTANDELRSLLPTDLRAMAEGGVVDNSSLRIDTREDPQALKHAVSLVGTCLHLCPDEELLRRERESDIQLLEIPKPGLLHPADWTLRNTVVKRFRRSAADYKLDVPEWVRPPDVLEKTCAYLEEWVMVSSYLRPLVLPVNYETTALNLDLLARG